MDYKYKYEKYKHKYLQLSQQGGKLTKKKYKMMRSSSIKKYDRNKDGIISIDEYLAEEISKGPKAKEGEIHYHYQNLGNVFNYFTILTLKKVKPFRVMCIPNFAVKEGKYITRTAGIVDIVGKKYYFSDDMPNAINKCRKKDIRIIYFTFIIKFGKQKLTHVNVAIIDLFAKTLERYEPYGAYKLGKTFKKDQKEVDSFFNDFVMGFLKIKDFKYISPLKMYKKIGIQTKADAYCGMCVTISMMYLQMRLMNLDKKQGKIIEHFTKKPKKKLREIILKFAKYVEDTLKDNADLVQELDYELYHKLWYEI